MLKDKEPGSFIVRDSHSFRGAYGLAMKVATPPPSVLQQSKKGKKKKTLGIRKQRERKCAIVTFCLFSQDKEITKRFPKISERQLIISKGTRAGKYEEFIAREKTVYFTFPVTSIKLVLGSNKYIGVFFKRHKKHRKPHIA